MPQKTVALSAVLEVQDQLRVLSSRCADKAALVAALREENQSLQARVAELEKQLADVPAQPVPAPTPKAKPRGKSRGTKRAVQDGQFTELKA